MTDERKCPFGDDCDLTVAYLAGYEKARADLVPRWSSDMDAAKKYEGHALLGWPNGRCAYVSSDIEGHLRRLNRITWHSPIHWMTLPAPPKGET